MIPLQITFKDMDASAALEARIRELAGRLERFEADIKRCHVTVAAPKHHHRQGGLYQVRIDIHVPRGDVVVTRESGQDHAHEDAYVAARDAFRAAARQLEDQARKIDGRVKLHEAPLVTGRVARFVADEAYGFIETAQGDVYFERHCVVDDAFDRLRVGDAVRIAVATGDKGLQASTVYPPGRHHAPEAA